MSFRGRIDALLVAEATSILSDAEERELEDLLAAHPEVDRYAYQRPAAAVFLAVGAASAAGMPVGLRSRILAAAERSLADGD
jgi:anti-sigma factor RsiW